MQSIVTDLCTNNEQDFADSKRYAFTALLHLQTALLVVAIICAVLWGGKAHSQTNNRVQSGILGASASADTTKTNKIEIDRSVLGVLPDEKVEININQMLGNSSAPIQTIDEQNILAINRQVLGVLGDEAISAASGLIVSLSATGNRGLSSGLGISGLNQLNAVLRRRATVDPTETESEGDLSNLINEGFAAEGGEGDEARDTILGNNQTAESAADGETKSTNTETSNTPPPIAHQRATITALDKVTAKTQTFSVPVGKVITFGPLRTRVRSCFAMPPTETPHTGAFIQISEVSHDTDEAKRLYSGWIFAESPGLTGMEHPVYDIWLNNCTQAVAPEITTENESAPSAALATGKVAIRSSVAE